MRQRLLSAAIGVSIGVAILFFYKTILLNFAMMAVILLSLSEAFKATHVNNRGLFVMSLLFAALVPFFHISGLKIAIPVFCLLYITALFILYLINHRSLTFEQLSAAFLLTVLVSFPLSTIVFLRDYYSKMPAAKDIGLFYILLVFFGAWITDAGAYFIGRLFGKTKLVPGISPKKTVEGALGGVACTLLIFIVAGLVYQHYAAANGTAIIISCPAIIVLSLLCSGAAILGDLAASQIKRESRIKDFGNILPGHGGMLDRFDSILFVAPLVMIYIQIFPVVRV